MKSLNIVYSTGLGGELNLIEYRNKYRTDEEIEQDESFDNWLFSDSDDYYEDDLDCYFNEFLTEDDYEDMFLATLEI